MAWHDWAEGDILYASDLDEQFTLVTAVLHNITGGQFAADAINAGTIIAVDVVDETHLNYADTINGVGCLQIGKDRANHEQMMVKGTCQATIATVTIQDVTFIYANADCVTAGEPVYSAVPHVYATVYTDDTDYVCDIKEVTTTKCVVQVGPGVDNIVTSQTVYVMVVGNI